MVYGLYINERKEIGSMSPTNVQLFKNLTNPMEFEHYKKNINGKCRKPKTKAYMTIVNNNLGYIVKYDDKTNQFDLLTIFNNKNPLLGNFIIESGIKMKNGKSIYITFHDLIQHVDVSRSLGMLIVFAKGEQLEDKYEAHHVQHSMVNFNNTVCKVTSTENKKTRPLIRNNLDAKAYNQARIVGEDGTRYTTLLVNLHALYNRYKRHNGIIVKGIDLTKLMICQENINQIQIETSLY